MNNIKFEVGKYYKTENGNVFLVGRFGTQKIATWMHTGACMELKCRLGGGGVRECDADGNLILPKPAHGQMWRDADGELLTLVEYEDPDGDICWLMVDNAFTVVYSCVKQDWEGHIPFHQMELIRE